MNREKYDQLVELAATLSSNHLSMKNDLVRARQEAGLTQQNVAERMGVTQPAVAEFERYDSNPTLATVERYALAVHARIMTRVKPINLPTYSESTSIGAPLTLKEPATPSSFKEQPVQTVAWQTRARQQVRELVGI